MSAVSNVRDIVRCLLVNPGTVLGDRESPLCTADIQRHRIVPAQKQPPRWAYSSPVVAQRYQQCLAGSIVSSRDVDWVNQAYVRYAAVCKIWRSSGNMDPVSYPARYADRIGLDQMVLHREKRLENPLIFIPGGITDQFILGFSAAPNEKKRVKDRPGPSGCCRCSVVFFSG